VIATEDVGTLVIETTQGNNSMTSMLVAGRMGRQPKPKAT
jgi:hypothetical protein